MSRARAVIVSVVGGLVGGIVGAGVMSAGHALVTAIASPRSEPSSGGGSGSPPQQDEDSTVKVGNHLSRLMRGRSLAESEKHVASEIVHYGFGATMGLVYGSASAALPAVTAGAGTAFGAAVWLGAHVITVPALGLARSPLRQPPGKEALELGLHLAYGVVVELVRRGALRLAGVDPLRTSR